VEQEPSSTAVLVVNVVHFKQYNVFTILVKRLRITPKSDVPFTFLPKCLAVIQYFIYVIFFKIYLRILVYTFYLLKYAKRIRHKLNKLMKSSPIYNKLQHYLIEQ
jgi:hypothetical protein